MDRYPYGSFSSSKKIVIALLSFALKSNFKPAGLKLLVLR